MRSLPHLIASRLTCGECGFLICCSVHGPRDAFEKMWCLGGKRSLNEHVAWAELVENIEYKNISIKY